MLLASGISLIGNQLTALALPWLVLTSIGTAWEAGIVGAGTVLPAVIGALGGGVITDRLGSRRMSIAADLASGVAVAAIPICALTIGLSTPLLFVLAFAGALLDAPGFTARQVLVPDLGDRAGMSRERANSLFQTVDNASLMIGPVIAGLAIVALGPVSALWLDAASFVVSAAIVAVAIPRGLGRGAGEDVADVLEGLRVLARDRVLRAVTLVAAVANFVGTPIFAVLLPALALRTAAGADAFGIMVGAYGGGLVAGSLGYGIVGARVGRRLVASLGFAGTGVAFAAVAIAPPLPVILIALAVGGVASGPINPIAFTVMQERVPAPVRGRVFGAVLGGVLVAAPVGMLALGALAEVQGPQIGLGIAGATFVLVGLVIAVWPPFRELDADPGATAED